MRWLACALMIVGSTGMAAASGGLSCAADDAGVLLSAEGGVTRGMGSALFSFSGSVELRDGDVEDDLRVTEFGREHVAQYWLDGDVLKLRLYREREASKPHGYVEAVIETGDGKGRYFVNVYDMTHAREGEAVTASFAGDVTCMVE